MGRRSIHLGVTAGGTGGHVYPAFAIAEAALRRRHRVTVFLAGQHREGHLAQAAERGLTAVPLSAPRLPGRSARLLVFPFAFGWAKLAAFRALHHAGCEALLGMGSFAAAPACAAAIGLRLPLLVHEGNAVIGKTNRLLRPWVRGLAYSLPPAPGQRLPKRAVFTGLPVRQALLDALESRKDVRPEDYQAWELLPERRTVLVFGGSQGAHRINAAVAQAAHGVAEQGDRLQLVHLTGASDQEMVQSAYAAAGLRACVRAYEPRMDRLYALADLVLCRAGAATITELALFAKSAILVPLACAADDHQTANAREFARRTPARVVPEAELSPALVTDLLSKWLAGQEILSRPEADPFQPPVDAAERVVDLVEEVV